MTEEELKEIMKKDLDEVFDVKPIIDFHFDFLQKAYVKGLDTGLKTGKSETKWHKVDDGDLPKDEEWKWCISRSGYPYVAKYEELFVSWRSQENKDVMCPYAWKEITLPKE